jgi:hypothetical protein
MQSRQAPVAFPPVVQQHDDARVPEPQVRSRQRQRLFPAQLVPPAYRQRDDGDVRRRLLLARALAVVARPEPHHDDDVPEPRQAQWLELSSHAPTAP